MGCFCADEKSLWSINDGHGWENRQETAAGLHTGSIYTPGRGFQFVLWWDVSEDAHVRVQRNEPFPSLEEFICNEKVLAR